MVRKGDWFSTYLGGRIYPMDLRPEDFHIADIAHALSMRCRFHGHCRRFLSVAEHSVLVHDLCVNKGAGLLHDAAEAYSDDLPRPVKRMPEFAAFTEFEQRIAAILMPVFGLSDRLPDDVKVADNVALSYEILENMNTDRDPEMRRNYANYLREHPHTEVRLRFLSPEAAERLFLDTFYRAFRLGPDAVRPVQQDDER